MAAGGTARATGLQDKGKAAFPRDHGGKRLAAGCLCPVSHTLSEGTGQRPRLQARAGVLGAGRGNGEAGVGSSGVQAGERGS